MQVVPIGGITRLGAGDFNEGLEAGTCFTRRCHDAAGWSHGM
jgi:hypothetical protein